MTQHVDSRRALLLDLITFGAGGPTKARLGSRCNKKTFKPRLIYSPALSGCICCTVRGDLVVALKKLHSKISQFDGVIIETTGLSLVCGVCMPPSSVFVWSVRRMRQNFPHPAVYSTKPLFVGKELPMDVVTKATVHNTHTHAHTHQRAVPPHTRAHTPTRTHQRAVPTRACVHLHFFSCVRGCGQGATQAPYE